MWGDWDALDKPSFWARSHRQQLFRGLGVHHHRRMSTMSDAQGNFLVASEQTPGPDGAQPQILQCRAGLGGFENQRRGLQ